MGQHKKNHVRDENGLTYLQRAFCEEYVKDMKVKEAYVRAGGSPKTAHSAGHRAFAIPEVQAYIQKLLNKRQKDNEVSANKVIASFQRIAYECEEQGNYKDALRALENLAKYLGLFTERRQTDITIHGSDKEQELNNEIKRLIALQHGDDDAAQLYDMEPEGNA